MARMPTFEEIRADFERVRAEQRTGHPFRRHDSAPQTPARAPATMEAAAAAARTEGTTVSLITDVEDGYAAVKNEIARLEGNLPAALEVAKKLEGNPLVGVALKAAEHVAAGLIPPEAVSYLAAQFAPALDGLLALYNPQGAAAAAPAAPAQAQQAVAAAQ